MKKLILTAAACAAIVAEALTVTDVTARQRWPWNNLVDVDFIINGTAGEAYYIDISATAAGGDKKLNATSFTTEPIAATGRNRIVWDLGADYPNFKADDLRVTVTATPFSDSTPLYLVVDISGGTAAAKWPVRYTTAAPVHTAGVADPCKTTELWLKRVKAKNMMFRMGGSNSGTFQYYTYHYCTFTNDFYLGVFELTQEQCKNISGDYMSKFTNETCRATRPADSIDPRNIRQPYFDSSDPGADITSGFMKNLRDRTGGLKFDLPTEWQFAYAGAAGTGNGRYNVTDRTAVRFSDTSKPSANNENYNTANQGDWPAEYGTSYVDAYDPNPWGFYGMLGNVFEACLNRRNYSITLDCELTDPLGDSGLGSERPQVGGSWNNDWTAAQVWCRVNLNPASTASDWVYGARICLTIGK